MNHSIQNGPPPSQPRQSRFKMGPPPTSLPPPSILTAQFTSVPPPMINLPSQMQSPTIAEKVITGMDSAPSSFDLRNKLLGVGGANLQYMRNETGAMVTLRGKGSGFIEPSTGTESLEPLHFYIEHPRPEGVREARTLAINLIETLQQELQQQQQQQPQQQQTHLFAFQQGALQTVQLGSVGQTGLLTLPHEVLQQAGLVTTSIGNINVPTILTQQHVGPLVAPPPPLSVPPPNIVQSQHIQQQQQLLQAQVQQQVQLPPPGVHIPTQQGPLVPPQQQQSQPPQQSSQTQSVLHQVHQFQLAPTNQQPPQIQQHLLAQPPPPIQQVLLSQAPPTVTSQAQTQQVLGLFHQPPPQTPQQTQQSLYVQAGLPLLHQPPPMVNAQLQFQIPPQQTQGSHQQQIISVPPPPPPPPQQSQTQTSQANQQVQANFISQSVPMHYTLQFQQTNPTSSTASLIQAPPHQSILDHQQAHQIQQQSQSQSNQLLQNQGGFVMTTPGSQSLVQVPPPVQMHHGVMAPPHLQPPQQQASVAVPLPVPAPAPPHSSSQVSSAMSTSFQPGIMTQSGMPIHQQQLPPHLQQHLHYQLPPGRQSPMHGQTAPHGPSSPASQQSQKDSKSPGSQENGQATRQGAAQNQSNGQQHQERRSSPQPLQRQGIGIEELIQMNHQQRQQLSVEPGSAQNGRQGPAPRDKTVMQQPSSAIGQDNWSDANGNQNQDSQNLGKGDKCIEDRDGKSSVGSYEEIHGRDRERERDRERQRDLDRRDSRERESGPFGRGRAGSRGMCSDERERERERERDRERERERERDRPTFNHYQSKPQLYNPNLPFHMHAPPPPPPPAAGGPGPGHNSSGQGQSAQANPALPYQQYPQQAYYQGWGLNPYAWMGQ